MRMRYVYYIIKENYGTIAEAELIVDKNSNNNIISYHIDKWDKVLKALELIQQVDAFKDIVDELLSLQIGMRRTDLKKETIPQELKQKYDGIRDRIINKMDTIIEICESAGFGELEQGFDVKMPPTTDFSEFAKYIKDLEFILSQCPYLRCPDEKIELMKTDSGSIWFEFGIIASTATALLNNLAKLVSKCVEIKSDAVHVKRQKEMLRSQELSNDAIEKKLNMLDELEDMYYERAKNELKETIGGDYNPEDDEKATQTIKKLTELMTKGLEIVSSLGSPDEVKNSFPISDEIESLPTPKKMLPSNEDEE